MARSSPPGSFGWVAASSSTTASNSNRPATSRDQLEPSRSGQLTERFTRAIDQLGAHDELEVVLGGIYALERIARDSPADRTTIAEVLTTYLRTHASRSSSHRPADEPAGASDDAHLWGLQARAPDLQAALTVLGRGEFDVKLDLHNTDLRHADLQRVARSCDVLGRLGLPTPVRPAAPRR